MKLKQTLSILAVLVLGAAAAYFLIERGHDHAEASAHDHDHGHDHGDHDHGGHGAHDDHADESRKGPHGGRLLEDGDFALELVIFEEGVPPEFRAWFTQGGKPVSPSAAKLSIELRRPGGVTDRYAFAPEGDYARGNAEVYEPHSFDYSIVADYAGRTHRWAFSAPEMQTTIPAEAARRSGVVVGEAGPAKMQETISVYGAVRLNANRIARAGPRFGGFIREARKTLGEAVVAGETIAVLETNQSLTTIEVKAPISGIILDRDANAGETVGEGATLYTIADLSEVWVDLNVPKRDQARVKTGQTVLIHADDGGSEARGTISWISPISSPEAQTLIARVVLSNPEQRWRPGLYVKAEITLAEETVPVAVTESGLQTLFDFTVVFSQHGDVYQARPLELGRRSGGYAEVRKGLRAGERYVTENSYLIKADIGKAGAAHEH
ncbi:MAG: efflux RND transporter periplasmic adaptor subunit [Opitutaceae bacterium]|nr:efflux RND transporter periplasmic adaptor subunit [Opitutaceae bacterium]